MINLVMGMLQEKSRKVDGGSLDNGDQDIP